MINNTNNNDRILDFMISEMYKRFICRNIWQTLKGGILQSEKINMAQNGMTHTWHYLIPG